MDGTIAGTNKAGVGANGLKVDGSAVTQPVSGSISVSNFPATQPISAASLPLPTGAATSTNQSTEISSLATIASNTTNAGTPVVSGTVTADAGTGNFTVVQGTGTNLHTVVDSGTITTVTNPVTVSQSTAANLNATVVGPTLTKGTQGGTGFSVQELKDSGRNVTNYYMPLQIVTTTTDTLQSLTGYKSGATVTATTTPAVVTAGKTYRVQSITMTYVAIATAGTATFTLRANTGGVVAIGSPAVNNWVVGGISATAGVTEELNVDFPDGLEFAAGTGIGVSMIGRGSTGTATAVGYGIISITGYEY